MTTGTTEWIDAHTHLDSEELYPKREQLLQHAYDSGVRKMVLVNSEATEPSFSRTLECAALQGPIAKFASLGIHPHHALSYNDELEQLLLSLLEQESVVAFGEIGLDYFYDFSPRDTQRSVLRRQLELAREKKLPVVIHCRDAYGELTDILRSIADEWHGMIHCFTGNREEVLPLLELGFFISFSGIVTFRNANELRDAARVVPIDRILIETDAPYLAPVPHRGKTNEPAFVVHTGTFLAELRKVAAPEFAGHVSRNFDSLFHRLP